MVSNRKIKPKPKDLDIVENTPPPKKGAKKSILLTLSKMPYK